MLLRTLVALLISTSGALAQLNWGAGGAGGTGTWDTTTQNWYNGTSNVVWDGNNAIFGGSQGTITGSTNLQATGLTFNTAGDILTSGVITAPSSGTFSVITNANATINTQLTTGFNSGAILLKDGTGTLTLSSVASNFAQLQINNGNLDVTGGADISFIPVTISNSSQASLSLNFGLFVAGLSGGGSSGGNVMPDGSSSSATISFTDGGVGSYAGSLQDNASNTLAVMVLQSSNQTLTGVNTYSGSTQVNNATLTISGGGKVTQTASITVSNGGTLLLDNSGTVVGDRIVDSAGVTLTGGNIAFLGNSAVATAETLGALKVGGGSASKVTITPDPAQSSSLTFASIAQGSASNTGAIVFRGPNLGATPGAGTANVFFTVAPTLVGGGGAPNTTTQSILPYALGDNSPTGNGTSFVTYGANGIRPLADSEYANDSFATATANVNVDAPDTLATTATVNALRLQDGGSIGGTGTLTVTSGAVLGLPGTSSISTAQLGFGANPIIFQVEGTTTVSSTITGTNSTAGFAKFGNGRLILSGPNSYSGQTRIDAGVLNIQNGSALGSTSASTTVATGAILEIQGGINVGAEALTVNGFGGMASVVSTGALRSLSGANTWAGTVTLNSGSIGVDSGSLTLTNLSVTGVQPGLTKVGSGTLDVVNAIPSAASTIAVAGGWLISNAASGDPFGMSVSLVDGSLGVAPSGTGGTPSLTFDGNTLSFSGNAALGVNKSGNTSATFTINTLLSRAGAGSTLLIIPADGLSALGTSEKLVTPNAGLTGSVASGALVGQNNDANQSGDFLTNSGANGLKVATYSATTNLNSAGGSLFQANTDQTLTNNQSIIGLKDDGHLIDLGTHQLQVFNGTGQSGVILNGGTIQNGQLSFSTTEGIIYTSLAGGTVSAQITGLNSLTTFGPGKLTLSGSNIYSGTTTVNGGNLNLTGSITSTVNLAPGAILSGTGTTTGNVGGGGLISPGNHVGILTANSAISQLTDSGSTLRTFTNFAFEFDQTGAPNFSSATASGNDLLHLTSHSSPFQTALTASNEIDLYLNVASALQPGQTYLGGFYSDKSAAFDSSILGATYDVFVSDPAGTTTFDGNNYDILPSDPIIVSTVPETANFGSGPVNGYVMEVQITPEPASCLALASGVAILGLLRPARRRS